MSGMFSISNDMFGTFIPFLLCVYGIEKLLLCIGWVQLSDNQQLFILNYWSQRKGARYTTVSHHSTAKANLQ